MATSLEEKVALVTGGGSGIGRATALAFCRQGARVTVADVDIASGEETVDMIKENGGEAVFVKTNVSKAVDVEVMVKNTVRIYGKLDCAFNNAGIEGISFTRTADYPEEIWDRVIDINLKGVWLCMKYELLQMMRQGGGCIINMSSTAGLIGSQVSGAAYGASKHGVIGLTKTSALEYARDGIRVNAVCPAVIRTRMAEKLFSEHPEREAQIAALHPIGRIGTPQEVADVVVWLCSDSAAFVTGHALPVDGGYVVR